jgi:hypothetical protein
MASETLVVRRGEAQKAREALFTARIRKEDLDTRVKRARKAVAESEAMAEVYAQDLRQIKSAHASLVKELAQAEIELARRSEVYEKAEAAYKSALETTKQSKSKAAEDSLKELEKAVYQAKTELQHMECVVSDLKTDLAVSDDELQAMTQEHRDAARKLKRTEARLDDIVSKQREASQKLNRREDEVEETTRSVEAIVITPEKLSKEWGNVSGLSATRRTPGYLRIRVPHKVIDPGVENVLEDMTLESVGNAIKERALRTIIARTGTAAEVGKAAEALGKRRWHALGLRVLAATWFDSLLSIAGYTRDPESGVMVPGDKPTQDIQVEFKDTAGLVESILIHQQDPDSGPLKEFARRYVKRVVDKRRINLSDFQIGLIADEFHAKILY